jgi:putative oxidoreductase
LNDAIKWRGSSGLQPRRQWHHRFPTFFKESIMNDRLQNPLNLAARLLMAALFLPAGIAKLTGFAGTVGYISSVGLPLPQVAAAMAVLIEIGGGIALVAGYGTRVAAIVLAGFTVVASVLFHNFWAMPLEQQMIQQLLFYKNIAVTGGLLALAAWGAGAWSLDGRVKSAPATLRHQHA